MVLTRPQAKAAFDHVLDKVLGKDDVSGLKMSLLNEGINDMFALVTLDDSTIDGLTYDKSDKDRNKPVNKADKNLLRIFLDYVVHRNSTEYPIGDEWSNITQEEFDAYRISPDYVASIKGRTVPAVAATTPQLAATPKYSPADIFRRGIKRDPSLFPTLKDERFNDSWHRSFMNQARAQDVTEVLDPKYKPTTSEQKELFDEKQKYVYAILESKVLTDRGKAFIREHEHDYDAQTVYKKITDHHLKSTKAMIDSSAILSYITSARLGNGDWRGSTEAFIIHWQDQVRLYERQVPPTDHFSDGQKRIMLENAVSSIDELRQVKNNADLEKAKSGKVLTYGQYVSLLLSASSAYDEQYKPRRTKRQAFVHDLYSDVGDSDDAQDNPHEHFDIDSPVSLIQAYAHERRPLPRPTRSMSTQHRVRMPHERWSKLSDTARSKWDAIDDKDKAVILGIAKDTGPTNDSRRSVNLHEISAYDFLQANLHDSSVLDTDSLANCGEVYHDAPQDPNTEETTILVNAAKSTSKPTRLDPGDIRRVMSNSSKRFSPSTNDTKSKVEANMHITYRVSAHRSSPVQSLVDRGANGGVAGSDVRVISKALPHRKVDIQGIDNHQMTDVDIGTVGGVVDTHQGPIIAIMHQYALFGKGHTIHSPGQLEWYKNEVDDRSIHVGGRQRIKTLDGYMIPLAIKNGLPRMAIRPYTDHEWETLPHVFLTSDLDWDPSVLDHDLSADEQWFDAASTLDSDPTTNLFDEFGNYRFRVTVQSAEYLLRQSDCELEDLINHCIYHAHSSDDSLLHLHYQVQEHETTDHDHDPLPTLPPLDPRELHKKDPDYSKLRPYFGWLSPDIIQKTFQHTTQYARIPMGTQLKRVFKSANPALNVPRRSEAVACDIVYADVPAIDDGSTAAVIFTGHDTFVTDVYGIKTDRQFVNTLEDNIRERGAPHKLISDRAQVEISKKVQDILRTLFISSWQSEPHQQQQNPAERRYQTIKNAANRVMDRTGAPPPTWLLCLVYVCFLFNHTYNETIRNVPITALTGVTADISVLLRFYFWQKVYYMREDYGFPSESREGVGRIVGISEHVGNALTWKILTDDTQRVIYRSQVRPHNEEDPNVRAALFGGEIDPTTSDPIIKSRFDEGMRDGEESKQPDTADQTTLTPIVNPEDLVGRTFLMDDKDDDGQKFRARVTRLIEDHQSDLEANPSRIKFVCSVNNDQAEEIITYNQLLDYIMRDEEHTTVWKFRRITSHQGPLKPEHPDYNGANYNVMVEWENGEITSEPLTVIAADDPVTCAIYAKENNLLDLPGWRRFKAIAKRQKKFTRMVNQAKLRSFNTAPRFKYGFEVPRNYNHAVRLDERNGNTLWQDAVALELQQIDEYNTFEDYGHKSKVAPPPGYKKIRVHLVFDVKHDGRHKARLVADGHLTEVPIDSVYSGVVSLRGFRLALFLAELNGLETWATDIGNAYLEAKTSEHVYIEAGPEFGDREGHILIIHKALYGLRSSGARWHDKFSDCLRELAFDPCKAEPDIWIRRNGNIYEYVAVYVDDLAIVMKDPQGFADTLTKKYKFKLKGTGPISFHLGMDFDRDEDGTLCIAPRKYIEKMIANYERMFGETPRQNVTAPLEKGDHPELDTSELLDDKGVKDYQSLIGALQWVITIGRFDVMTAVMTLSGFRAAPRKGHLDRVKRIYGYLSKMRSAAIRVRVDEPDYSDLPNFEYDWSKAVYGDVEELIPKDAPAPLGKHVTLTHYVDANLMHDLITGRSVTGILHFVNKMPIDWYSKKQATVETATYGSEFVASRTCVEQIIDLRNTLRYLGVPIREKSYMFGDNQSVVNSSTQVHAKLHKRHTMLSFHRVREAIASGYITFHFIPGQSNPADILSKHWGYSQVWTQLKSILFWRGDTADIE